MFKPNKQTLMNFTYFFSLQIEKKVINLPLILLRLIYKLV
jgi:hypothetical protein